MGRAEQRLAPGLAEAFGAVVPLELTDLVGLDVRLAIAEYLSEAVSSAFTPPKVLRELVDGGRLGQKSGRGFYEWDGRKKIS